MVRGGGRFGRDGGAPGHLGDSGRASQACAAPAADIKPATKLTRNGQHLQFQINYLHVPQ
jgi:hypothetical protein